ncbi:uncharacterized protein SPAPADRAFT_62253, partial [Spathaspora passalidarum NRRL Y-27907]
MTVSTSKCTQLITCERPKSTMIFSHVIAWFGMSSSSESTPCVSQQPSKIKKSRERFFYRQM